MILRTCTKCQKRKPATERYFYKKSSVKCGLTAQCRPCINRYQKLEYQANPEPKKANARKWRAVPERRLERLKYDAIRYRQTRTTALAYERHRNLIDPLHQKRKRDAAAAWAKANPRRVYEQTRRRLLIKRRAMPSWVNVTELKNVYLNCPPGMDVDHIVPLKSRVVCGLHVPWNLQYLTPVANRQKHNKFQVYFEIAPSYQRID